MNKLSKAVTGVVIIGSALFGAYDYHHNRQPITVEYEELYSLYYKYSFATGCKTYGFMDEPTLQKAKSLVKRMSFKDPKFITKDNPEGYGGLKPEAFDDLKTITNQLFSIRDIDDAEVWTNTKIQCAQIEVSLNGLMSNIRERYLYF